MPFLRSARSSTFVAPIAIWNERVSRFATNDTLVETAGHPLLTVQSEMDQTADRL